MLPHLHLPLNSLDNPELLSLLHLPLRPCRCPQTPPQASPCPHTRRQSSPVHLSLMAATFSGSVLSVIIHILNYNLVDFIMFYIQVVGLSSLLNTSGSLWCWWSIQLSYDLFSFILVSCDLFSYNLFSFWFLDQLTQQRIARVSKNRKFLE